MAVFTNTPLSLSDTERVVAVVVMHETTNSANECEYRICKSDADRLTDMLRSNEKTNNQRL